MRIFRLAVALMMAMASAEAQNAGALSGVVTDSSGAAIPQAAVEVRNLATNVQRTQLTDAQGRYSFTQLQPGTYDVNAKAKGFADFAVKAVAILINTASTVDLKLELAGVQQTVAVSAEATQVNTQDATLGNAIGTRPIVELPFDANVVGCSRSARGHFFADPSQRDDTKRSVNGHERSGQCDLDVDVNDQQNSTAFTSRCGPR